jgi:hypothetical protein
MGRCEKKGGEPAEGSLSLVFLGVSQKIKDNSLQGKNFS